MNSEILKRNIKRKSEFSRTNRIRLDLFSFAKNEINEKRKETNDCFSFRCNTIDQKEQNSENKEINKELNKKISLDSKKTTNNSFNASESEMSCEEEN